MSNSIGPLDRCLNHLKAIQEDVEQLTKEFTQGYSKFKTWTKSLAASREEEINHHVPHFAAAKKTYDLGLRILEAIKKETPAVIASVTPDSFVGQAPIKTEILKSVPAELQPTCERVEKILEGFVKGLNEAEKSLNNLIYASITKDLPPLERAAEWWKWFTGRQYAMEKLAEFRQQEAAKVY